MSQEIRLVQETMRSCHLWTGDHRAPCFSRPRIPVAIVVGMITHGMTPEEIVAELPPLLVDGFNQLTLWLNRQPTSLDQAQ
jgi:hypothetical protein